MGLQSMFARLCTHHKLNATDRNISMQALIPSHLFASLASPFVSFVLSFVSFVLSFASFVLRFASFVLRFASFVLRNLLLVAAAWLLLTAGCAQAPAPPAPVTLQIAAVPAAADLVSQASKAYTAAHSYVTIDPSEDDNDEALAAVASGQADLAFIERPLLTAETLDPVTGKRSLWSWPIGRDGVAIIVHPTNPLASLTMEQLQRAFTGDEADWQALGGAPGPVQVVIREDGAAVRTAFEHGVLQGKRVAPTAIIMPNDQAVADYVSHNPGAIGYISMGALLPGVKVIGINNVLPLPSEIARGRYPLSHPLFLVARSPLTTRAWSMVSYLLSPQGQSLIAAECAPPM